MEKNDKLALGVSLGFAGGAIFGIVLGLLTNDFAAWLAIGIGCGIALGSVIGLFLGKLKYQNPLNREKIIIGYAMAIVGFLMLINNAIAYLLDLDFKAPILTVMGIVFVVIGMGIVRKF